MLLTSEFSGSKLILSILKLINLYTDFCGRGCSGILCCLNIICAILLITIYSVTTKIASSKDTAEDPVVAVKNETATSRPKKKREKCK